MAAKTRSRGELKVAEILKTNNMCFKEEYSFPDLISSSGKPLRFDFAVFDDDGNIDFLIEYQGEQHYEAFNHFGGKRNLARQKYNDQQKRTYCMRKEIPLVAIPYWKFSELDYDTLINCAYSGGGVL